MLSVDANIKLSSLNFKSKISRTTIALQSNITTTKSTIQESVRKQQKQKHFSVSEYSSEYLDTLSEHFLFWFGLK